MHPFDAKMLTFAVGNIALISMMWFGMSAIFEMALHPKPKPEPEPEPEPVVQEPIDPFKNKSVRVIGIASTDTGLCSADLSYKSARTFLDRSWETACKFCGVNDSETKLPRNVRKPYEAMEENLQAGVDAVMRLPYGSYAVMAPSSCDDEAREAFLKTVLDGVAKDAAPADVAQALCETMNKNYGSTFWHHDKYADEFVCYNEKAAAALHVFAVKYDGETMLYPSLHKMVQAQIEFSNENPSKAMTEDHVAQLLEAVVTLSEDPDATVDLPYGQALTYTFREHVDHMLERAEQKVAMESTSEKTDSVTSMRM